MSLAVCPWCKETPETYKHSYSGRQYYRVRCRGQCPVKPQTYQCATAEDAEKTWNGYMKPMKGDKT